MERDCPECGAPTLVVANGADGEDLVLDREHHPDGYVVVRNDIGSVLSDPQKAVRLLEAAGAPAADRYRKHVCKREGLRRRR